MLVKRLTISSPPNSAHQPVYLEIPRLEDLIRARFDAETAHRIKAIALNMGKIDTRYANSTKKNWDFEAARMYELGATPELYPWVTLSRFSEAVYKRYYETSKLCYSDADIANWEYMKAFFDNYQLHHKISRYGEPSKELQVVGGQRNASKEASGRPSKRQRTSSTPGPDVSETASRSAGRFYSPYVVGSHTPGPLRQHFLPRPQPQPLCQPTVTDNALLRGMWPSLRDTGSQVSNYASMQGIQGLPLHQSFMGSPFAVRCEFNPEDRASGCPSPPFNSSDSSVRLASGSPPAQQETNIQLLDFVERLGLAPLMNGATGELAGIPSAGIGDAMYTPPLLRKAEIGIHPADVFVVPDSRPSTPTISAAPSASPKELWDSLENLCNMSTFLGSNPFADTSSRPKAPQNTGTLPEWANDAYGLFPGGGLPHVAREDKDDDDGEVNSAPITIIHSDGQDTWRDSPGASDYDY